MKDADLETWLPDGKLYFDDEELAALPFFFSEDEGADSSGQNPQTLIADRPFPLSDDEGAPADSSRQNPQILIAEPTASDAPSSSLLGGQEPSHNEYEKCLKTLLEIFPAISLEYVRELYDTWMQTPRSNADTNQVLRAFEDITLQLLETKSIPKEKDRTNELKRKRPSALGGDKEEMSQRNSSREGLKNARYMNAASWELQTEFVDLPANIINRKLQEEGSCYAAYLALAKDEMAFDNVGKSPHPRLKHPRRMRTRLAYDSQPDSVGYNKPGIQRELQAAIKQIAEIRAKRKAEADAVEAEAAMEKLHRDNGEIFECQCCFEEFTMNKITYCDGDTMHYFCLDCAKRNADNEIGNMRHKLTCMSGDVCTASFSGNERRRFLDEKTLLALDRIELQAAIKEAGVEIVWCPFCEFGASCPPVSIDKEFRCQGTDCGKVSCRICQNESHTPFTCDEWKRETQTNEQHILEEARTAALLKKCPKCNVPIIKEDGCNRLRCPCGGIMCDYCGKEITSTGYSHFRNDYGDKEDDQKCPADDDFDTRRRNAVKTAETDALKEARARNPDLDLEALRTKFPDDAPSAKDHRRREARAEVARLRAIVRERGAEFRAHHPFMQRPAQAPAAPAVPLPQNHQIQQPHQSVFGPPQHHQTHQTNQPVVPPQYHQIHQTHQSEVPPPGLYQPRQTHQFTAPSVGIQPNRLGVNPAHFYSPHLPAYGAMMFHQPAQYTFNPPYHRPSQPNAYGPAVAPDLNSQPAAWPNIRRNY